ncbi:MAG TPA: alpha/beta fold hydrolase [Ilumatobacteraceae bacterium]|nr:alpha/beta fold hydrolase [Ilumatobacteraceae bacterium]
MSDWRRLPGELAAWTRGNGPRLVFVHGFTQTSASWKPIAAHFAGSGYESIVVDAPGHGGSGEVRADLVKTAEWLTAMCGTAVYIGYSMGGRLCLHAAAMFAEQVRGLALVGASPGIADEGERQARRVADDQLADHIECVGVDVFLDEWLAQPLFSGLVVDEEQLADRLRNSAAGLASSLQLNGTGAQASLWPQVGTMTMPILAIAGEVDEKFVSIGREIALAAPAAHFEMIPGAGHAAHLQNPGLVCDLLQRWLGDIKW